MRRPVLALLRISRASTSESSPSLTLFVCACVLIGLVSTPTAHPHDEADIVIVKGTLTTVDPVNQIIEVDTVEPTTKTARNVLLFVERGARIRDGKKRVSLKDLQPGRRVTCTVERTHQDRRGGRERLIVFEVRVEA